MTVDPRSDRAIYRQVADILRAQIADGTLAPGSMLPSEKQLADTYDVGRDAIRQAIGVLRTEGAVRTEKGRGSVVRGGIERQPVVLVKGARVIVRMPTEPERASLGMDEGEPIIEVFVGPRGSAEIYPGLSVYLLA